MVNDITPTGVKDFANAMSGLSTFSAVVCAIQNDTVGVKRSIAAGKFFDGLKGLAREFE